mmetsp:Transcript_16737/g.43221  ORF Transcript_16737/g.43221 Transcript_16737/m.43221 type:complete len:436 (-) Transcript_16737:119-1426(-)
MTVPRSLRGLFAMLFVEIFGSALTIPVFTYFCIAELKLTATYVGLIMSMFSAAQLFGAPVVGRLSDAWGRRNALLGCFCWTSVCFLATAGVKTFSGLLIVRTFAGLSGGSIPVTQAMIMDVTTQEERPSVLGVMGGLLGVAFTLAPGTIVLVLSMWDLERRWVFVAASLFALVGCIVGYFVLEETLPERKRRPICTAGEDSKHCKTVAEDIWDCCTPSLMCIWVGRFCSSFANLCLFSTYAFLIRDAFGWGDRELGMVLASGGIIGALIQLLLYPGMSKAMGKHTVYGFGAALVTMYFIALPIATLDQRSIQFHLGLKVLFISGTAIMDPGIPDLVAYHAPEDRMGLVQGMTNGFRALASVAAPLVAGRAFDISPYFVYFMAAMAAAVSGVCVACATLFDTRHGLEAGVAGRLACMGEKLAGTLERGETKLLLKK